MEIGGAVVGETTKSIIGHLEREIGYLVYFRRNVDNLNCKFQQLDAEKNVVADLISRASNNNEVIRETVKTWLRNVDAIQTDVTQLTDEAGKISSYFKGWFCSRFQLGRKAYKKISDIQGLLDRRNTFGNTVSDPKPIQSFERVFAYDYENFASRKSLTKEIVDALSNDNKCLVGVFGMPGIGKTKLMEALSKWVKEEKLFDEVVMVTISQNPDVKTIQNYVGKQLDMQLKENESIYDRAMQLQDRLKKDRKTLIVLDDLWSELKLEEVGIPRKKDCKSYKIVITTRFVQVCRQMETDLELEVPVLSDSDSWTLFREKVGGVVDSHALETIARKVVGECAGLPLAIVTLGKALRNQTSVSVWADRLRRLQKSIHEDSMEVVDSSIKLIYDFSLNEVQKRCFLCCSLFPEDYNISIKEDLLVYVVGEKLLEDGVDCFNSLEETKERLYSIVEDLISSSLVLRVYNGRNEVGHTVKMHDVVRDVAKIIASKDEKFKQLDAAPSELMKWSEKLESCKRLVLMPTKITCNLPRQIEAPQLLTLILTGFKDFSELPCDFFKEMKNLRNLNLSDTKIASLPPSVSCLVELLTLRLRWCSSLRSTSPIEKLGKLELLDLRKSGIERLPEEMGMLTNLKSLNIKDSSYFLNISPGVISNMGQLEELYANGLFDWELFPNLSEVTSLAKLTCLEIKIRSVESFSTNTSVPWERLKEYTVVVRSGRCSNHCETDLMKRGFQRNLHLHASISVPIPNEVIWLLRKADYIRLHINDVKSVVQVDPTGGFKDNSLKRLEVMHCSELKYLMSSIEVEKYPDISFSSLQELYFYSVYSLKSICNGETLPHGFLYNLKKLYFFSCSRLTCLINWKAQNLGNTSASSCSIFSNLKRLSLEECEEIRYVLPMSVARGLNQLVELRVTYCPSIEMIIKNDNGKDDEGDNNILPRLKILYLRNLSALASFGRPGLVFDWDSLKELILRSCGNLKSLPCRVTQQRFSKFKYFELSNTLIHLLEDPTIREDLEQQNLNRVKTRRDREKLLCVFQSSSLSGPQSNCARGLNQLVKLFVRWCPNIETIIANDNGEEDDGDNYIPPLLERLYLINLPALVSFGRPGLVFDWDSLKVLELFKCGNLKSLPCRVTQQRLSKFKVFELGDTLIHLLEDPAIIIDDLEHVVFGDRSYYHVTIK